jgi:tetratricopeptide (TPR) repeat protein
MRRIALPHVSFFVMATLLAACATPKTRVELEVDVPRKSTGTAESYNYYIEGYLNELDGNLEEAGKIYSRSLEKDPNSPHLLTRLASILIRQGKLEMAEKLVRRAASLDPSNKHAHLLLGGIYTALGRLKSAVDVYERLLEIDPDEREARLLLGTAYVELKRYKDGVQAFSNLIDLNPGDILSRLYRAQANFQLKEFEQTEKDLNFLLERGSTEYPGVIVSRPDCRASEKLRESRGNL